MKKKVIAFDRSCSIVRERTDRLRQQRNSCSDQRGSCNNS